MASIPRIKAIFCDMDGTLLNPSHRISDFTAETLKELKRKDIKFVVCTGRPYPDVFATIRKCGLAPDYIITSNGARIHDKDFNLLKSHNMDPKVVKSILLIDETPSLDGKLATESAAKTEKRFATNVYSAAEWWTDKRIEKAVEAYDESFACIDFSGKLKEVPEEKLGEVHEMWFLGQEEDLVGLERYMKNTYGDTLRCSYSLPYLLDCVPSHVTKGSALKEVCQLLNITPAEAASFGDGMNDAPMLQTAGHPFLMENAQQALKDAIPNGEVIKSNSQDGVAVKLHELFLS